eukprot:2012623-Prymnesium_polylepis.3
MRSSRLLAARLDICRKTIGTLQLVDSGGSVMWKRSGDHSPAWRLSDTIYVHSTAIEIQNFRGALCTGDAAVSYVSVTCGIAPPRSPLLPPMPPSPPSPPSAPPLTVF